MNLLGKVLELRLGDIPCGVPIFLIVIILVPILPFYGDIYYRIKKLFFKNSLSKKEKIEWVEQIHFDLLYKLLKLRDDPFMSNYKLREWLPICEYADTLMITTLPQTQMMSLERFLLNIISDPEEMAV